MFINKELVNVVINIGLCHLDNLGSLPTEMLLTLFFIEIVFLCIKNKP